MKNGVLVPRERWRNSSVWVSTIVGSQQAKWQAAYISESYPGLEFTGRSDLYGFLPFRPPVSKLVGALHLGTLPRVNMYIRSVLYGFLLSQQAKWWVHDISESSPRRSDLYRFLPFSAPNNEANWQVLTLNLSPLGEQGLCRRHVSPRISVQVSITFSPNCKENWHRLMLAFGDMR